jgi:hypothetical protein
MIKFFFALLLVIIVNGCLYAQNETQWLPDQPGKWSFHHKIHGEVEKYKLTSTELITFQKKIDTIAETFHQNPVLKNPVGFDPSLNVLVWPDDKVGFKTISLANAIIEYRIAIQFCPLFRDESGNVKKHCMEVTSCDIHVNQPKATTERYLNYQGDGYHEELSVAAGRLSRLFVKPLVARELAEGVTAYQSGIIIISDPKRPYWIPVTVGELFELLLNYYELDYKFNQKEGVLYVIDVIKNERAAYSPEELKLPAYFDNKYISYITKNVNENQYVRFNPDYFDKSLPRTSIQLIAVHTLTESFDRNCDDTHLEYRRHCEFVKQFDGNALKALIDVK